MLPDESRPPWATTTIAYVRFRRIRSDVPPDLDPGSKFVIKPGPLPSAPAADGALRVGMVVVVGVSTVWKTPWVPWVRSDSTQFIIRDLKAESAEG